MRTAHIKGKAERITETISIYLRPSFPANKRIICRDTIRRATVDIDPQYISKEISSYILPVTTRIGCVPVFHMAGSHIIGSAPIANGNIEIAIWSKCQGAAIVIALG